MEAEIENPVDHFANLLEVEYLQRSFEKARCRLTVHDQYRNALGGIHGGIIFSLADIAFAAACNAAGETHIGMQAEIRYMRGATGGALEAEATLVGSTRKFAHYSVVVSDGSGQQIALFTSSAYKLSP